MIGFEAKHPVNTVRRPVWRRMFHRGTIKSHKNVDVWPLLAHASGNVAKGVETHVVGRMHPDKFARRAGRELPLGEASLITPRKRPIGSKTQ